MRMDDGHGSLGGHSARPWHCVLREDCVDGDELLDEVENGGWCFTCILFERYPLTNIPHCGRLRILGQCCKRGEAFLL